MEENFLQIKSLLGQGSINIFGLPMSGKDTVGKRLAGDLGAEFLSSGDIIRAVEAEQSLHMTDQGKLIPTNKFFDIVLPYFFREELRSRALVLSSIGRWAGEENEVIAKAKESGHEIRLAIELAMSEEEARRRWEAAKQLNDRGTRADDADAEVFETRIAEYHEKTAPVLAHYDELGLLVRVNGEQSREQVYRAVVEAIGQKLGA